MNNNMKEPTKWESGVIKFMILLGIFSVMNFLLFFFQPEYQGHYLLFTLLSFTLLYGVLKKFYVWYNYSNISIPRTPEKIPDLSVDVLTTYFPGEPYDMITNTLTAILKIRYPHKTYLCDEADDPFLKEFCEERGIIHVTRDNRIDAKAGNINNALRTVATGDICVILDPDHVPEPAFLDPILPHFANPDIGFVQIVQSYYNIEESLVARGAAEQTFQFYGPMMMTLNAYGSVNAIGANCVFRRAALDSIGGHAAGLCEDMHTTMLLYSKGWKAVYLPVVLAKGLAPSTLTNYFKQQLKWARGTFDLLVKVYPRIFSKLTGRQRIHFAILPMHYFGGVISLINFLIPILALLFSTTPWRGNIIDFILVLLPVAASAILVRTYIQKWVIEKKERGFHIIGGLLHINTWWIYILGLFYTLIDKKVPYLPTPKEGENSTNLKIIIPNAIVAILSIFAIVYGLSRDLTPFSIVMAGFAFFNAFIMIFGIYLTIRTKNQEKLTEEKQHPRISLLPALKRSFYRSSNLAFIATRFIALPLLLTVLIASMSFKQHNDLHRWNQVEPFYIQKKVYDYLGIFHPAQDDGLVNFKDIDAIEGRQGLEFDIISFYLAWTKESVEAFPDEIMTRIYAKDAIPMITWEPWASPLEVDDPSGELNKEKKVLKHITEGRFDSYIKAFANHLKTYDKPVYLRFAHEFDNPQYPWSGAGDNTPLEFVEAWQHVYGLIKSQQADKVMMVWNPWKAHGMEDYYPGDEFVDWVGVTALNYGELNPDQRYYSFKELYQEFHEGLHAFTRKPVMLAEFGSVKTGNRQNEWITDAIQSVKSEFKEISAVVLFNSAYDKNIPLNEQYEHKYIDWTVDSLDLITDHLDNLHTRSPQKEESLSDMGAASFDPNPITTHEIRGVRYKKGIDWKENYFVLTKEVLVKDFDLLKKTGINTIQFTGGNIYDYNLLTYSREFDLKVLYQFNINNSIDFIQDKEKLESLKEEILSKVESFKDQTNLIGYSFDFALEEYYSKPLLFHQRKAFLNWLQSLSREIKAIDPGKSLVLDMQLNADTKAQLQRIHNTLPIDSYGLVVEDPKYLNEVESFSKQQGISLLISSVSPELLINNQSKFSNNDLILENWQDERLSNRLSFDGLVDFEGRKKPILKGIESIWANAEESFITDPVIKVLKPSKPIHPGRVYNFDAYIYKDGEWVAARKINSDYEFEWHLIKNDAFGNPLAIKKLGSGPSLDIKTPREYKLYDLLLTASKNNRDYVVRSKTPLHTPLKK